MKRHPQCNCPMRLPATVRVTLPPNRWGESHEVHMCPSCATAWNENNQPTPQPEQFSEEWLRSRIDANTADLAAAIDAWLSVDTTNIHAVSSAAAKLCLHSRNISAYAGDLAQLSSRKAWAAR